MEEQLWLRCGEANPNQGLGRTSGQKPNADTVQFRGMETEPMEIILRFALDSLSKIETDLLGSWWP